MTHDNRKQSAPSEPKEQGEDVEPISLDTNSAGNSAEEQSGDSPQKEPEIDTEYSAPIAPAGDADEEDTGASEEEGITAGDEHTTPGKEDPSHDTDDIVENGADQSPAAKDETAVAASADDDDTGEETPESDDEDDVDTITIVEALIFASDEPLTFKQIKDVIEASGAALSEAGSDDSGEDEQDDTDEGNDTSADEDVTAHPPAEKRKKPKLTIGKVRKWVESINETYEEDGRPFRIVEVAGGFSFQTIAAYGQYVGRLYTERSKRRLTQAALETLAIVAYKQPISKPGVEAIRGVNADYVVKSLLEKNLIAIVGREDTVGRPLLYGTTKQFLKHFGLHSLNDLPKPREIEELLKESEEELAPPIEINADQLPHPHHFDEPSIFDDVEREYGPQMEHESNGDTAQGLADALNGNGFHKEDEEQTTPDVAEVDEETPVDDITETTGDETRDDSQEEIDDSPPDDDEPQETLEQPREHPEDEQQDEKLPGETETNDSVEHNGQDENLPDADTADDDAEKE